MSKEVREVKSKVKGLIKWGHSREVILDICINEFKAMSSDILSDIVEDTVNDYPNYGLIQKIMRSKIVCGSIGESSILTLLDEDKRRIDDYDRSRLKEILHPKFDLVSRIYTCRFEYKPLMAGMLLKDKEDGTYIYNTYQPPFWQKDWFYSNGKEVPTYRKELPEIYEKFFRHLVGDEDDSEASYYYLLKWLANGLRRRNYCILTTIGNQGIGKGVLGAIMKALFGENNYYEGSDKMFKSNFNSQIADRRLVYCDEISIQGREDEDRLKLVVNNTIEIEKKGIDAKAIDNYASFYISSNNMDSIKISADDRRFSIIQLTSEKLLKFMNVDDILDLTKSDNIKELAEFLWHYEVDVEEMGVVFKSKRTQEVRLNALQNWEDWFLFDFCVNNLGKFFDISNELNEIFQLDQGIKIGRGKLQELEKKYSGYFKVRNIKGNQPRRTWHVVVNEEIHDEEV